MTVHLGPVCPTLAEPSVVSTGNGSNYNPHCLKRDVSVWVSSRYNADQQSTNLITQHRTIGDFQTYMQGNFSAGFYGVHTGGHFTMSGDQGGDIFTSPGDPAFWVHHAQIDRTWWIWQNLDLGERQNAIAGTITLDDSPLSRNGTLDDWLSLGINAEDLQIKDAMSTLAGPFCYVYM